MMVLGPRPATVDVDALSVDGELPQEWRASTNSAVLSGLSRGALEVRAACVSQDCADASPEFIVSGSLSIVDRDYAVRLEVRRPGSETVVASTEGFCELCGVEEAVEMIEGRAAVLAPKIEQLGASAPVLVFRSTPAAVEIIVDDESRGPTPVSIQTEAGPHVVEAQKVGYLPQSFEVQAIDGVEQELSVRLVPVPDAPPPSGRGLRIAGVGTLSAALVALGVGVPLLVLHGRDYDRECNADVTGRCQFDYDTQTGGIIGVAVGGALAVTGAVLLGVGVKRGRQSQAVSVSPGGVTLRF